METTSLTSGSGGRPLGTERPSATLPASTGQLFAREVERATERSRGDGFQARRLAEMTAERRALRRAGFGARHEDGEGAGLHAQAARSPRPAPSAQAAAPAAASRGAPRPVAEEPSTSAGEPSPAAAPAASADSRPAPANIDVALPGAPAASAPSAPASPAPAAGPAADAPSPPRADVRPAESVSGAGSSAQRTNRASSPAAAPPPTEAAPAEALERAQEIVHQIRLHLSPHVRRLTLDLQPGELGRIAVQLAWRSGKVAAIVRAERPETFELLRLREGDLRALFAERGIEADSVRLELGFAGQREPDRRHLAPPMSAPIPGARRADEAAIDPPRTARASRSIVDTYA